MKHAPIIQEHLDTLTTRQEKIRYLLYAYKEWIIGIAIIAIFTISIVTSILTTRHPDVTIKIVSDVPAPTTYIDDVQSQISQQLPEDTFVVIDNVFSADQMQALMIQLAAQEIDLITFYEIDEQAFLENQLPYLDKDSGFEINNNVVIYPLTAKSGNTFVQTLVDHYQKSE